MRKTDPTQQLVDVLSASAMHVVDDRIHLSDHDIYRELQLRQELDNSLIAERQRELNNMFPERTSGALYEPLTENHTFDF